MVDITHKVLLADDDLDDCIFFKEALEELPISVSLSTTHDGMQLMQLLNTYVPDMLFLDLNMPLKTGFECLKEIRCNYSLRHLPVIISSTSYDLEMVNALYKTGADYYMRKPGQFSHLRDIIHRTINLISNPQKPPRNLKNFVLNSE